MSYCYLQESHLFHRKTLNIIHAHKLIFKVNFFTIIIIIYLFVVRYVIIYIINI